MRRLGWARFVAVAVLALAAVVAVRRLPSWGAGFVERRLALRFGAPATVGRVAFHAFPPEIEVFDVRVAAPRAALPPLFEAKKVTIRPSLLTLGQTHLVLSRVRLDQPRIHVASLADGASNLPPASRDASPGAPGGEVRIRRLIVEGGEIAIDNERIPLEMDLPDFKVRLAARRGGTLVGPVSFAPGRLRFGKAPPLPLGLDADVEWSSRRLAFANGHARAVNTTLAVEGELDLAGGVKGTLRLQGNVDLDELDASVFRTSLGLKGRGPWVGSTSIDGSSVRFEGQLGGANGAFDGLAVARYSTRLDWDGTDLRLRRLDLQTLGGSAVLDLDVPTDGRAGDVHVQGTLDDVDLEGLAGFVFGIGAPGIGARAKGDVDLRWPNARRRALSGRIGLDLRGAGDARTDVSGRIDWTADRGEQVLEKAELVTAAASVRLSGRIDSSDHAFLDAAGTAGDLAAADDLGARLRRALGSASARAAGFSGQGAFQGRVSGTLASPVFDGRFNGPSVAFSGVDWGEAAWEGEVDEAEVRSRALSIRRGNATLRLSGRSSIAAGDDAIDLKVAFTQWPAQDFVKAFGWRLDAEGDVSGEAVLADRRSAPRGTARVASRAGRFYRIPFADLDLDLELLGTSTKARRGAARVGGGGVEFSGTLSDQGVYDAELRASAVEIEDVLPARAEGANLAGQVSAQVLLRGTAERPILEARLTSPRLFLGDEGLGDLDATLRGAGDGAIAVRARSVSSRLDATIEGTVSAVAPNLCSLELRTKGAGLDPYLRALAPGWPQALKLISAGSVQVRGPLQAPSSLEAEAEATLDVILPEYHLASTGPVAITFAAGRIDLREARFTGEGSDVRVGGTLALGDKRALDLSATGRADLRVVSVFTERLRGRGAAELRLNVSGTPDEPRLDGTLRIESGGIRVRGFPQGIEDVRGTVRFTENVAVLEGVSATAGGGAIGLEGQAAYASGGLRSFDIRAKGRDIALRYPEGLRSRVGADIRVFGDVSRQWVTGAIEVDEAVLTRRYDLASELLRTASPSAASSSLYEGLRYDVKVHAPGTLRIDNNLATLAARADLRLQGTYDRPVLLGRAEIEKGRVYFQGQSYTIRHGTLDFANPQRVDPFFDVEGETRVRSYTVTLRLNGTLDRVTPTLSSDPPLDTLGVLTLLAGAPESTVTEAGFQSGTDRIQQNLAVAGAAAFVSRAAPLTRDVQQGVERVAERVGLSRFSIDPSLARGSNTNPTARLTLGKRLSRDLDFYYSVDLKSTQEKLYSLEYSVSERLSLLVTKAEPEGLGVDLRLKKSR